MLQLLIGNRKNHIREGDPLVNSMYWKLKNASISGGNFHCGIVWDVDVSLSQFQNSGPPRMWWNRDRETPLLFFCHGGLCFVSYTSACFQAPACFTFNDVRNACFTLAWYVNSIAAVTSHFCLVVTSWLFVYVYIASLSAGLLY